MKTTKVLSLSLGSVISIGVTAVRRDLLDHQLRSPAMPLQVDDHALEGGRTDCRIRVNCHPSSVGCPHPGRRQRRAALRAAFRTRDPVPVGRARMAG